VLERNAAEGVHRIEDAYVNFYVVEEGGRLTIVDTAHPSSWRVLHGALHELGRSPGDVDAVVLTHGHFDHMGFAERARREWRVPVWAHERERPVTRHPWRYDHERSRLPYLRHVAFVKILAAMAGAGALRVKGAEEVRTYGSEGALDVPGRPRIIFTPGHTHGHCALHFPDRGAAIVGDAFVMLDPYTGRAGPRVVARAATGDSATALASLDALAALDADTLFTGHGPAWRGRASEAVARAREAGVA
jgi:glyoxylase-like metal-dependent hydrolase (beta-lactamase superfamily II)